MEWLIENFARYVADWDFATTTIYVGLLIVFIWLCRVLDMEKSIKQRLDEIDEVATGNRGDNPTDTFQDQKSYSCGGTLGYECYPYSPDQNLQPVNAPADCQAGNRGNEPGVVR